MSGNYEVGKVWKETVDYCFTSCLKICLEGLRKSTDIVTLKNLCPARELTRNILEKLFVARLVKKFSEFYGTQKFIAVFIRTSY
jgi:hypothetical protein